MHTMQDFDFKKCTRKCAETEREIAPGDVYFSAIIENIDGMQRLDFSEKEWNGPPEGCVGWWQSRIPVLGGGRVYWAPKHVLSAYFESLVDNPGQSAAAFVMGLVLIRKRILRWEDSIERDGKEYMCLKRNADKKVFEVQTCELSPQEVQTIQSDLAEQLFTDQATDTDPIEDESNEVDS